MLRQPRQRHDRAVFKDVHVLDDAVLLAVARQIADAKGQRLLRGGDGHGVSVHVHLPLIPALRAEHRAEQLAASVAQKARDAQHLARAHAQAHIAEVRLLRQAFKAENLFAEFRLFRLAARVYLVADHLPGNLRNGRILHIAVGHHHAVAQHGIAVADLHHLAQLVRDEDHADLLRLQRAQHIKNALDLRIGERRRRLIHDDDGSVHHQRACNFDNLFEGRVQRGDHGARINLQVHLLEERLRLLVHRRMIEKTAFLFDFASDEHVFVYGQVVDQVQLLMDKSDARAQRLGRICKGDSPAIELDGSPVCRKHAAQNIHQRRFSRAVFTQQRADFTLVQVKIDGLEHVVRAKGFDNSLHCQIHAFTSVPVKSITIVVLPDTGEHRLNIPQERKGHGKATALFCGE